MSIHPPLPITSISLALIAHDLIPRDPGAPPAAVTVARGPGDELEVTTINLPNNDTFDLHLIERDLDWIAAGLVGPLGLGEIAPRRWVHSDDYSLVPASCGDIECSACDRPVEDPPFLDLDPVWDVPIDLAGDPTAVHLVDINGTSHTEVAWLDDRGPLRRAELQPTRGLAHDGSLRLLGLPTAPPDASVLAAVATAWLDHVVGAHIADPAQVDWSGAVELFPLRGFVECTADPDDMILAGWAIEEELTWHDWRHATIAPDQYPALSAWVDDGMFARLMLSHHPDLDDLIGLLEALAGRLTRSLRPILEAWGLAPHPSTVR
jgi:hypothetical protein